MCLGRPLTPGHEGARHARGRTWVRPRGLAHLVGGPAPHPWWPDYSASDARAEMWAWLRRGREVLWFDETE
jgi:hypothetical protein